MRRTAIPILLLATVLLVGCTTNPSTGRRQFTLFSPQEVAAMGQSAKPELVREYGGEVKSPELRAYITRVGRHLARQTEPEYRGTEWEFTTLDSDVINAFALPGGKVFISRGLLELFENEAQVAGVLGHEIGHVTARHVDERISWALSLQLGLQLGSNLTESELAVAAADLFSQGYLLKFGRNQENEADMQALKYTSLGGYDPAGMADVIQVLIDASGDSGTWEILSTHPNPQSRLEDVQNALAGEYRHTQNNPEYKKHRNRFQREAAPYLQPSRVTVAQASFAPGWCGLCRTGTHPIGFSRSRFPVAHAP